MEFLSQYPFVLVGSQPEIEMALLLCCARTSIDSMIAERVRTLVQHPIDWEKLIPLAEWHSVLPLLYQTLNRVCPEAVPAPVLKQLQHSFHAIALNNQLFMQTLLNVLKQFEAAEIPVLTFKGPLLAIAVYGDLNLRQFNDLDLLVPRSAFARATALLIGQNYDPYQRLEWQTAFAHSVSQVGIDLHRALTPPSFGFNLRFEALRSRLQPHPFNNHQLLCLAPIDLLLILCVSFCRDRHEQKSRLIQLCDVVELVRVHPELDWEQVLKQAHRLGISRMVLATLALGHQLLSLPLPEIIQAQLHSNPSIDALIEPVQSWLWYDLDSRAVQGEESSHDHSFYFKLRERWSDKALYFIHYASLPVAHPLRLPLPKALDNLYLIRKLLGPKHNLLRLKGWVHKSQLFLRLSPQESIRLVHAWGLFPIIAIALRYWNIRQVQGILAGLSPPSAALATPAQVEQTVHRVEIAARQYSPDWANCLKRSLVLWYLLRRQGIESDLRIGVRREQGEFQAHAWVEYQGKVLNDVPEVHERFAAFETAIAK